MRLLETSNDHSTSQTSRRTQCPPQKNALSDITAIHFWPNIYDWFLQRIPHLILILLQAILKTRSTRIQKSCLTNLHLNTHKYRHMYMPIYIYTYMCICVYIYTISLFLSMYYTHYIVCVAVLHLCSGWTFQPQPLLPGVPGTFVPNTEPCKRSWHRCCTWVGIVAASHLVNG